MHLVPLLVQQPPRGDTAASFQAGQFIGVLLGIVLLGGPLLGSIFRIISWPKSVKGRIPLGLLLLALPFSGAIAAGLFRAMGESPPDTVILVIPFGFVGWGVLYVYLGRAYKRDLANGLFWREGPLLSKPATIVRDTLEYHPPEQAYGPSPQPAAQRSAVSSGGVAAGNAPVNQPLWPDTPVVARCATCMGRWKTTAAKAAALEACPKCGDAPPSLRLQPI